MNVLIVFTDQQRKDSIGAYGNKTAQTPNLDKLAKKSVVFDNAICPQPVCTPSRGSLMTGVYPHTHGAIINNMVQDGYYEMSLPDDIPTIADLLQPYGYKAGYVGKWHVGREIEPQHGFEDYWISTEDEYTRPEDHDRLGYCKYNEYLLEQGYIPEGDFFSREETSQLPEEHSRIAFITREAERFMEMNQKNDFVLVVNYLEPHPPYHSFCDDMYGDDMVQLPENYHQKAIDGMSKRASVFQEFTQMLPQSGEGPFQTDQNGEMWHPIIQRYYGLVTLADKYIGKLLDKLDALNLEDDTLIVFTSDHGDMMGSHGMINKCVMYDEALQVPYIIHHPKNKQHKRISEVVNLADVVPTILAALGRTIPDSIEGENLLPLINGERQDNPNKPGFSEWNGVLQWMHKRHDLFKQVEDCYIRTVRTEKWKLNVNYNDKWELYDLKNDPGEMHNLIYQPAYEDKRIELYQQLINWQEKTNDRIMKNDCT